MESGRPMPLGRVSPRRPPQFQHTFPAVVYLTRHMSLRLEINVGMMCGSIPCMKPLYARLRYGKSVNQSASTGSYQLSDRFASKAGNAIYRHHDIEHTTGPAEVPRAESEDSILPRGVTYGQVETRVQGPSSPRGPPGQAW